MSEKKLSPEEAEAWVKEFGKERENGRGTFGKSRLVHIDCASEDHYACVAPFCECECHERANELLANQKSAILKAVEGLRQNSHFHHGSYVQGHNHALDKALTAIKETTE